jgi:cytochrome d ubiquinol oxidase subunit I
VLPTYLAVSSLSAATVATSLGGFVLFYTALLVVEVYLMRKYIGQGPQEETPSSGELLAPGVAE